MGVLIDLKDKIKKYYKFRKSEITGLIFAIFVIGFIISFKEWGTDDFNARLGTINFFNATLIVALSFLVHDAGQRIWGLAIGFRTQYKPFTYGLVAGLLLAFVTNGRLWLILPSSFIVHHMAGHRLGFFRYDIAYFGKAMIAFGGVLATITLMILFKVIGYFVTNPLIDKLILFNVIFLITTLLPIPPLDGSVIYFGSRMLYAFLFPFVAATSILLLIDINIIVALATSLFLGVVLWIAYYVIFERYFWPQ